jgi:hypothetical protein
VGEGFRRRRLHRQLEEHADPRPGPVRARRRMPEPGPQAGPHLRGPGRQSQTPSRSRPSPPTSVWFARHYGSDPVFDVFGKPAVVWSGSWQFTTLRSPRFERRSARPDRLLLLGSEKDAASYTARAGLFDGDAYYWSSADPLTTPGYEKRLTSSLAAAVHAGTAVARAGGGRVRRSLNGGTTHRRPAQRRDADGGLGRC